MKALIRIFSTANYKGTRNYIDSQKKFEIIRTLLFFAISASLFIAGYVATKTKVNYLTVIAVVGCLPACKSLISAIMFLRYKSCSLSVCESLDRITYDLTEVYDMVFTSYDKNFNIAHMIIAGNTICGYTESDTFDEKAFQAHITNVLKLDGHKNATVKIFTDLDKYLERIRQLSESEADTSNSDAIATTLKSVVL